MALSDSGPPGAAPAVAGPASAVDARLSVAPPLSRLLRECEAARAQAADLARDNQRLAAFLSLASHALHGPVLSSSLGVQLAVQRVDLLCEQAAQCDATLTSRLAAVQDSLTTAASSLERLTRLTRLVSDLLDLSHIKAGHLGHLRGQLAPADLLAIVRAAVDEQRQLAATRCLRLRLRLRLPASHHGVQAVSVWADADRIIYQVVTTLLTNALKYAPADRPVDVRVRVRMRVRVRVRVRVRQGWARVSVCDQGPGLPAEEHQRIWEAFHRADGADVTGGTPHASAQSLGLGLGRYVCKTIIEHHQGEVGVRSTLGKGSTFWFALPVRPVRPVMSVVAGVRTDEDEALQPASDVA
jgi:signal transduction histidine kinase